MNATKLNRCLEILGQRKFRRCSKYAAHTARNFCRCSTVHL